MIANISAKIGLNDGGSMPGYGFGLYKQQGQELLDAVKIAWQCGYRLFDTAAFYKNEETVGEALAPYPASETFLVSKIWPTDFSNPAKALEKSLRKLRREYLDAYLLHWPGGDEKAMLKAFEYLLKAKETGMIHSAGVSNFLKTHLERLYKEFALWPAINQLEIHPYFQQRELCAFCRGHDIAIMAWSPLGRGNELGEKVIDELAQETKKTPAQIILRWHIQEGRIPIPKSTHGNRIMENADVFDFSLTETQMRALDNLQKPGVEGRRGADPMSFAG